MRLASSTRSSCVTLPSPRGDLAASPCRSADRADTGGPSCPSAKTRSPRWTSAGTASWRGRCPTRGTSRPSLRARRGPRRSTRRRRAGWPAGGCATSRRTTTGCRPDSTARPPTRRRTAHRHRSSSGADRPASATRITFAVSTSIITRSIMVIMVVAGQRVLPGVERRMRRDGVDQVHLAGLALVLAEGRDLLRVGRPGHDRPIAEAPAGVVGGVAVVLHAVGRELLVRAGRRRPAPRGCSRG